MRTFATSAVFVLLAILALATASVGARQAPSSSAAPLAGKTVVIDPGHNGGNAAHPDTINKQVPAGGFKKACDTTGTATASGKLTEHHFNWDLAERLRKLLERDGAKVVMTRENDRGVGPCINRRATIGNRANADVAISLHADGAPAGGHGFHVIHPGTVEGYTEPIVEPSLTLARDVRDALVEAGLKTSTYAGRRGLHRRTDIGGINLSKVPKVLVEHGNMRNGGDARRMKRKSWRQSTARALRDALTAYLTP
ncbi:MAG: N-acetylmuramoyl-L-alanine amidase [Actinobacteria bacterium]|nr:N-acetylmuramoyl-L-alanine amidase [Actinomycetota bacterium]